MGNIWMLAARSHFSASLLKAFLTSQADIFTLWSLTSFISLGNLKYWDLYCDRLGRVGSHLELKQGGIQISNRVVVAGHEAQQNHQKVENVTDGTHRPTQNGDSAETQRATPTPSRQASSSIVSHHEPKSSPVPQLDAGTSGNHHQINNRSEGTSQKCCTSEGWRIAEEAT